jgi:hypothetical protein
MKERKKQRKRKKASKRSSAPKATPTTSKRVHPADADPSTTRDAPPARSTRTGLGSHSCSSPTLLRPPCAHTLCEHRSSAPKPRKPRTTPHTDRRQVCTPPPGLREGSGSALSQAQRDSDSDSLAAAHTLPGPQRRSCTQSKHTDPASSPRTPLAPRLA